MAEPKTKKTNASVENFLDTIKDETRRDDCHAVMKIMQELTKSEPRMWGSSIVGFGEYHYIYADGKGADWPLTAFSPRKQSLVLYMTPGFDKDPELKKLGKYKTSKSCLYINKLEEIHIPTLKNLIKTSLKDFKKQLAAKKK